MSRKRTVWTLLMCMLLCMLPGICPAQAATGETMPVQAVMELLGEYRDDSIYVRVEKYDVQGTACYVARIAIEEASQLRTEPAYTFERDQTADAASIAQRVGAVLAINGDYFSYMSGGYMIRQGVQYREKPMEGRDVLLIDSRGDFHIEKAATEESLAKYAQMDIVNSFNFGPGLVVDGEVLDGYEAKYNASLKSRQRSCIAQVESGKLEYICVSCEGPVESEDGGLTMAQFAAFVKSLGVENAYNLDGGDSTALIFEGEKLNAAGNRNHRPISDIIYFASTVREEETP